MSEQTPTSGPPANASNRRRGPRMENSGAVRAELISVRARVHVPEIGLGGFSVVTAFPLESGRIYRFRFSESLADEMPSRVRARVVYCRTSAGPDGARFLSGLAFVDERPRDRDAVGRLIDRVTAGLSFELS